MSVKDRAGRWGRIGPVATFVDHVSEDGLVVRWGSRCRKHLTGVPTVGSTCWAPRASAS